MVTSEDTPRARLVQVAAEQQGQRIDNYLITQIKGVPKSLVYRILRKGEVRVNKGRVKPDYRVQAGDTVRIPPLRTAAEKAPARPGDRVLKEVERSILYEDAWLLVLNKPSGIAVHGGSGLSYGMIEALRALRPKAPFLELVHRLDRETSGCLIIAKKRSALRALHELIRANAVDKRYLTLLKGRWEGGSRRVNVPLRKNVLKSGERMVCVSEDGKEALSVFEPRTVYAEASLVEVDLITGRTHQVRAHAAHIGHPIAGDEKYGEAAFNAAMRRHGLKRLFLHASELRFQHPGTGEPLRVSAPLPEDLTAVLDKLEKGG